MEKEKKVLFFFMATIVIFFLIGLVTFKFVDFSSFLVDKAIDVNSASEICDTEGFVSLMLNLPTIVISVGTGMIITFLLRWVIGFQIFLTVFATFIHSIGFWVKNQFVRDCLSKAALYLNCFFCVCCLVMYILITFLGFAVSITTVIINLIIARICVIDLIISIKFIKKYYKKEYSNVKKVFSNSFKDNVIEGEIVNDDK